MAKPTLKDCIQDGLMEIKRLNKLSALYPLSKNIDSDIPFAATFLAGWIRESIKNRTVGVEEKP